MTGDLKSMEIYDYPAVKLETIQQNPTHSLKTI